MMIERRTLRHEIKDYLLELIMSKQLLPGNRIVETRLAKELQVSQAPVREAIRELEQMNLIETIPHQGTFVKKFNKEEMAEAYYLREALEGFATRQATEHISNLEIQELEEMIFEMEIFASKGKMTELAEKDIKFHEKIFEISANKLLIKTYNIVKMNNLFVIGPKLSNKDLQEVAQRHRSIVEALKLKDVDQAEQVARLHVREISHEALKNIVD